MNKLESTLNLLIISSTWGDQETRKVLNSGSLSNKAILQFASWNAKQALALIANPDPRSTKAVEVLDLFIEGKATKAEMDAAANAANAAAYATANAANAAANAANAAAHAANAAAYWNKVKQKLLQLVIEENNIDNKYINYLYA